MNYEIKRLERKVEFLLDNKIIFEINRDMKNKGFLFRTIVHHKTGVGKFSIFDTDVEKLIQKAVHKANKIGWSIKILEVDPDTINYLNGYDIPKKKVVSEKIEVVKTKAKSKKKRVSSKKNKIKEIHPLFRGL